MTLREMINANKIPLAHKNYLLDRWDEVIDDMGEIPECGQGISATWDNGRFNETVCITWDGDELRCNGAYRRDGKKEYWLFYKEDGSYEFSNKKSYPIYNRVCVEFNGA